MASRAISAVAELLVIVLELCVPAYPRRYLSSSRVNRQDAKSKAARKLPRDLDGRHAYSDN